MKSVIDRNLAVKLAENNYFYIMHRFNVDPISFSKEMQERGLFASISVGVKQSDYDKLYELFGSEIYPEYITIDIAHGHADTVVSMIKFIKNKSPNTFLIAGNVCTKEGTKLLKNAGADCIKVGIDPGSACITRLKTGFSSSSWQLSAIKECKKVAGEILIMADGNIRHNGDIAKSLVFVADMCMIGGMLTGFDESPGKTIKNGRGEYVKEFYGSAS